MTGVTATVYLARHGETEWSVTGQHTGATDLPLTVRGERNARHLGARLRGLRVAAVFTSPLQRARRTCDLAGFGDRATVDADMVEWDYGDYEGRTTADIQQERPGWNLFRDGCPNGETAAQVGARADRVIARLRRVDGDALVFGHRHFLSVLGARWVGLPAEQGHIFTLGEASVSILGYNHTIDGPVVQLWNDCRHV
ncbi:MAG TPA: histidine phosphatase family protein [Verrucomicrobiae bacterium]|nr:histidine phosphatase family protein [Verrucomicrobiae bacterium]